MGNAVLQRGSWSFQVLSCRKTCDARGHDDALACRLHNHAAVCDAQLNRELVISTSDN